MGFFGIYISSKKRSRKHGHKTRLRTSVKMDGSRPLLDLQQGIVETSVKADGSIPWSDLPQGTVETSVETDGSISWPDLPQGILESILNRLHLWDQVRALAVCKNWQLCKNYIKCSDRLPWVVSYDKIGATSDNKIEFVCELFDPYSQTIVSEVSLEIDSGVLYVLDSRHGWLLLGDESTYLFLHNPFTNEKIDLDMLSESSNMQAIMSASPASPECGIFMLSKEDDLYFTLNACYLSEHGPSGTEVVIDEMDGNVYIYSMLYMKGNCYYALCEDDVLNVYVLKDLEDGTPDLLASGFPEPYESCNRMERVWLMEVDENLIMVRVDREGKLLKWTIFRFDWPEMSWVFDTNLKSCAIYLTWNAAFSAPLTDISGEILEGCRLFYLDPHDNGMEIKHYSMNEAGGTRIQPSEYGWINMISGRDWSFIEPSYYSN